MPFDLLLFEIAYSAAAAVWLCFVIGLALLAWREDDDGERLSGDW